MRSILFDLDGVIIDSMPYHARAWQLAFKDEMLVDISADIFFKVEGKPNRDVIEDVAAVLKIPQTIGKELSAKLDASKNRNFDKIFLLQEVAGASELIKFLHGLGYHMGVATGSHRQLAQELLSQLGLLRYFTDLVGAEDVKNGKPHPEPYLNLLEKLEGDKNQALVIENAPLGVQSALAAGLTCFAITSNNTASDLNEATLVFDCLDDIRMFLENEYKFSHGKGDWLFIKEGKN
jgi:HAD superfamily hydrolase (TIGR01509 family)